MDRIAVVDIVFISSLQRVERIELLVAYKARLRADQPQQRQRGASGVLGMRAVEIEVLGLSLALRNRVLDCLIGSARSIARRVSVGTLALPVVAPLLSVDLFVLGQLGCDFPMPEQFSILRVV